MALISPHYLYLGSRAFDLWSKCRYIEITCCKVTINNFSAVFVTEKFVIVSQKVIVNQNILSIKISKLYMTYKNWNYIVDFNINCNKISRDSLEFLRNLKKLYKIFMTSIVTLLLVTIFFVQSHECSWNLA